MTLTQLNGGSPTGRSAGRRPKGGVSRRVLQAKMPAPLREALVGIAAESRMPLSDLGTYYLIRGWNLTRRDQGLEPISMPEYLEAAVRPHVTAEHERNSVGCSRGAAPGPLVNSSAGRCAMRAGQRTEHGERVFGAAQNPTATELRAAPAALDRRRCASVLDQGQPDYRGPSREGTLVPLQDAGEASSAPADVVYGRLRPRGGVVV